MNWEKMFLANQQKYGSLSIDYDLGVNPAITTDGDPRIHFQAAGRVLNEPTTAGGQRAPTKSVPALRGDSGTGDR